MSQEPEELKGALRAGGANDLFHEAAFSPQDKLSDEEHYLNDEHNPDYDHEAFLGEDEARTFDQLTPEESKERLG